MDKVLVRYAIAEDIASLAQADRWPKVEAWRSKIAAHEVVVAIEDSTLVGHARFEVLWTTVPFLGMIQVVPSRRGQGISLRILDFLKAELRRAGYVALLSSCQTNELEPQNWHRHMGFRSNGIIENIADDDVGESVWRMVL